MEPTETGRLLGLCSLYRNAGDNLDSNLHLALSYIPCVSGWTIEIRDTIPIQPTATITYVDIVKVCGGSINVDVLSGAYFAPVRVNFVFMVRS
jgi:hypothetical protein